MHKKGFTLIELMVVIAIIAVLAAVVAPQVFRQIAKGRRASVEAFYNSVKIAATSYFGDTGQWPPSSATGAAFITNPGGAVASTWDGPYLERWPANNPWGGAYQWQRVTSTFFGPGSVQERRLYITAVPLADAQKIDTDIDQTAGRTTGWVRYSAAGANRNVWILVSRDGATN